MMEILRDLLSFGSPKEKPNRHWQEIIVVRRKVEELERRMDLAESQRFILRPPLPGGAREVAKKPEEDCA